MLTRSAAVAVALFASTSIALADPYDQCGTFVLGLEGCVLFQPDGGGQQVQPQTTPPAIGTRARVRGDQSICISFCFVPCILAPTITPCQPPCRPDFDGSGVLAPDDIFAFLNAWFAGNIGADYDQSGALGVQDIFDFINAWFAGCP